MTLTESDKFHIRSAEGWLGLGNHLEANDELENVAPEAREHPAVLELRWQIYAKESKWDACRKVAAVLLKQRPDLASVWLHLSYSARRATGGGIQAAFDVLSPAAKNSRTSRRLLTTSPVTLASLGN